MTAVIPAVMAGGWTKHPEVFQHSQRGDPCQALMQTSPTHPTSLSTLSTGATSEGTLSLVLSSRLWKDSKRRTTPSV